MKFETAQIHFWGYDFSAAKPSSLIKLPII